MYFMYTGGLWSEGGEVAKGGREGGRGLENWGLMGGKGRGGMRGLFVRDSRWVFC